MTAENRRNKNRANKRRWQTQEESQDLKPKSFLRKKCHKPTLVENTSKALASPRKVGSHFRQHFLMLELVLVEDMSKAVANPTRVEM